MGIFSTLRSITRGASAARSAPANQAASARSVAKGNIRSPLVQARQARANALRPLTDANRQVQTAKSQGRNVGRDFGFGAGEQEDDQKSSSTARQPAQLELVKARPRGGKLAGEPRVYRRYPHRLTTTDFVVSAFLYPTPIFPLIGGIFSDWDTVYIRYHLVHARVLWVLFFLPPIFPFFSFFLWMYMWLLGFRAYSGKRTRVPILTWYMRRVDRIEPNPKLNHNPPIYKR